MGHICLTHSLIVESGNSAGAVCQKKLPTDIVTAASSLGYYSVEAECIWYILFIHFFKAFCFVFTNLDVIVFGCQVLVFVFNFWRNLKGNCYVCVCARMHTYTHTHHVCGKKKLAR